MGVPPYTTNSTPPYPRVISGTTGTLARADNGASVQCTNGSAVALTVPADLGPFQCLILQMGAGAVTPTTDGTTTISGAGGKVATAAQFAEISLISTAADAFVVAGNAA